MISFFFISSKKYLLLLWMLSDFLINTDFISTEENLPIES